MSFTIIDHSGGFPHALAGPLHTLAAGIDDCYALLRDEGGMAGSCMLSSLICRDFLRRVGFNGAEARAVVLKASCVRDGRAIRRVSAGDPAEAHRYVPVPGRWNGHMCTTLPGSGLLVDLALVGLMRPKWDEVVQRGVVVPLKADAKRPGHAGTLARIEAVLPAGLVTVTWETSTDKAWRKYPDVKRRDLRAAAVEYLVDLHQRKTA